MSQSALCSIPLSTLTGTDSNRQPQRPIEVRLIYDIFFLCFIRSNRRTQAGGTLLGLEPTV